MVILEWVDLLRWCFRAHSHSIVPFFILSGGKGAFLSIPFRSFVQIFYALMIFYSLCWEGCFYRHTFVYSKYYTYDIISA